MTNPRDRHLRLISPAPDEPETESVSSWSELRAQYLAETTGQHAADVVKILDAVHGASVALHRSTPKDQSWADSLLKLKGDDIRAALLSCIALANLDPSFFHTAANEAQVPTMLGR